MPQLNHYIEKVIIKLHLEKIVARNQKQKLIPITLLSIYIQFRHYAKELGILPRGVKIAIGKEYGSLFINLLIQPVNTH